MQCEYELYNLAVNQKKQPQIQWHPTWCKESDGKLSQDTLTPSEVLQGVLFNFSHILCFISHIQQYIETHDTRARAI